MEGAGSLLLLAAAQETGLVAALRAALPVALPADNHRRDYQTPASRQALVLTLLFLGAVGLRRTWDLRGYTGDALALLAGRGRPYGYRHVERFLAAVARAGGAETLTDGVTAWAARLWSPSHRTAGEPPPAHYIDGHRKAVYSEALVPRGLVARRGTVLGCRALTLLHDEHGHPLLATTHRGDTHLTAGLPAIVARYEAVAGAGTVRRIIVDREGLAAPLLARLAAEGRTVVTILRANQHAGLDSFTEVGDFTPLDHDATGHVVREVAPARFALPLPDRPGQTLALGVALVRDHRRQVPCGAADAPDLAPLGMHWGTADWVATATPAPPTAPKLVPIVTTATDVDAPALVRAYQRRWPCQENVIRDFLLPLGLDTNHGYAKTAVENSEVAKRRATLERRLTNARRWGEAARVRADRAGVLSHRRWQAAEDRSDALYRALNARHFALGAEGAPEGQWRAARRELTAAADAELAGWWARYHRALDTSNREFVKHERYCREQGDLLRALAELAADERAMYELDDAKDQAMTALKVALANLAMWARDHYFPADYARASWQRLAPFFRLPGRVVAGPGTVTVELRPFNDRHLTRDLAALCLQATQVRPRLPDGRRLVFAVRGDHDAAPRSMPAAGAGRRSTTGISRVTLRW